MKRVAPAILILLLASACSTNDGFIDQRTLGCDSGEDISVRAGIVGITAGMERGTDLLQLGVEVSNNAHHDVTVKSVRAEQVSDERSRYRVLPVHRQFDQTIGEGQDHLFELPMDGRGFVDPVSRTAVRFEMALSVTVALSNGDSYRCVFSVSPPI